MQVSASFSKCRSYQTKIHFLLKQNRKYFILLNTFIKKNTVLLAHIRISMYIYTCIQTNIFIDVYMYIFRLLFILQCVITCVDWHILEACFQRPTSHYKVLHRRSRVCMLLFTCQNGEECLTQILRHTNRIDAEHLKLPKPEYMKPSEHEGERGTFLAGSDAGFRHRAGPSIGEVRLDHASLSAIPLCVFLYLLQR